MAEEKNECSFKIIEDSVNSTTIGRIETMKQVGFLKGIDRFVTKRWEFFFDKV